MGPAAFARERGLAMGVEVGLPLIQMVAPQAQLMGHRGCRSTGGFPEPNRFDLKFFGEPLPFRLQTPPRGIVPL